MVIQAAYIAALFAFVEAAGHAVTGTNRFAACHRTSNVLTSNLPGAQLYTQVPRPACYKTLSSTRLAHGFFIRM